MLPEWKLVRGETLKIRKKKATFAIIFISIFSIIKHIGKSIERFERGMTAMFMYSCVCDRQMGNVGSFHVQSLIEKAHRLLCDKEDLCAFFVPNLIK